MKNLMADIKRYRLWLYLLPYLLLFYPATSGAAPLERALFEAHYVTLFPNLAYILVTYNIVGRIQIIAPYLITRKGRDWYETRVVQISMGSVFIYLAMLYGWYFLYYPTMGVDYPLRLIILFLFLNTIMMLTVSWILCQHNGKHLFMAICLELFFHYAFIYPFGSFLA